MKMNENRKKWMYRILTVILAVVMSITMMLLTFLAESEQVYAAKISSQEDPVDGIDGRLMKSCTIYYKKKKGWDKEAVYKYKYDSYDDPVRIDTSYYGSNGYFDIEYQRNNGKKTSYEFSNYEYCGNAQQGASAEYDSSGKRTKVDGRTIQYNNKGLISQMSGAYDREYGYGKKTNFSYKYYPNGFPKMSKTSGARKETTYYNKHGLITRQKDISMYSGSDYKYRTGKWKYKYTKSGLVKSVTFTYIYHMKKGGTEKGTEKITFSYNNRKIDGKRYAAMVNSLAMASTITGKTSFWY